MHASGIEDIEDCLLELRRIAQEVGFTESLPSSRDSPRVRRAARTAERWLDAGVHVIPTARFSTCAVDGEPLPPLLFAHGRVGEPFIDTVSILNSRKPRRVSPEDLWIRAVKAVFAACVDTGSIVVSSYGTLPFDLVTRLAAMNGNRTVVVCDGPLPAMAGPSAREAFLRDRGDLYHSPRTLFLSPFPPGPQADKAFRSRTRDRLITALSSRIGVGALREDGAMTGLVEAALGAGVPVSVASTETDDPLFRGNRRLLGAPGPLRPTEIPVEQSTGRRPTETRGDPTDGPRSGALILRSRPAPGEWLIHYTRSCNGPWPAQTVGEYCRSLLEGDANASHTAFDTLKRILTEGVIRGGRRLIRGGVPVVSFTERFPSELEKLVKWRSGLLRWAFEPYGIAIPRRVLERLGAEPVVYGDDRTYNAMPYDRRYLFQPAETARNSWVSEREWRLRGDLSLDAVRKKDITIVVPSVEEAREVRYEFGYETTLAGMDRPKAMSESRS